MAELVSTIRRRPVFSCCYDLPLVRERETITSSISDLSLSNLNSRNWADLPTDLIGSIVELLSTVDYLRFGAVCTSWAASVSLFIPRGPQMPFLLDKYSLMLDDITDGRRLAWPLPDTEGKWCIGSQDGWLALVDRRSEMSLFNPITRSQIQLPSITTIDGVEPIYDSRGSLKEYHVTIIYGLKPTVTLDCLRYFIKAVVFPKPTVGSCNPVAILFFHNNHLYATTTTAAARKWIRIRVEEPVFDIINYGGGDCSQFLMKSKYGLWALDVTGDSPKLTKLMENSDSGCAGKNMYLANSNGDILLVVIAIATRKLRALDHVKIFRLENECWVPLRGGLGGKSLFVGSCSSFSLSVREIPDLKPNSVYCNWIEEGEGVRRFRFGRFHLEDGSVEYCGQSPVVDSSYFIPAFSSSN